MTENSVNEADVQHIRVKFAAGHNNVHALNHNPRWYKYELCMTDIVQFHIAKQIFNMLKFKPASRLLLFNDRIYVRANQRCSHINPIFPTCCKFSCHP